MCCFMLSFFACFYHCYIPLRLPAHARRFLLVILHLCLLLLLRLLLRLLLLCLIEHMYFRFVMYQGRALYGFVFEAMEEDDLFDGAGPSDPPPAPEVTLLGGRGQRGGRRFLAEAKQRPAAKKGKSLPCLCCSSKRKAGEKFCLVHMRSVSAMLCQAKDRLPLCLFYIVPQPHQ